MNRAQILLMLSIMGLITLVILAVLMSQQPGPDPGQAGPGIPGPHMSPQVIKCL